MRTAYGEWALPEDVKDWKIPETALPQLVEARAQLMTVLSSAAIVAANPETAADAQYNYDCWVKQQQGNWRIDAIEECRDGFYEAIAKLTGAKMEETSSSAAPIVSTPMPQVSVTPALETKRDNYNYRVFFDFDSAIITPRMQKVIDHIVEEIKGLKGYEYVLNGYTDRVGTEEYNLELSKKRAIAVRKKLLEAGVPEKSISIFAYGEADNAVETEAGIPEAENRRVEIVISD